MIELGDIPQPELLQCPCCGSDPLFVGSGKVGLVFCSECGMRTHEFATDNCAYPFDIAIETWNRRPPAETQLVSSAVPQWTTERPKEEGLYLSYSSWNKEIVMIRVSKDKVDYWKDVEEDPRTVWLKLDVPPLPEGGRANES